MDWFEEKRKIGARAYQGKNPYVTDRPVFTGKRLKILNTDIELAKDVTYPIEDNIEEIPVKYYSSNNEPVCEFCKKALDKDKGELDHGCLDCAGSIYQREDGSEFCQHCEDKLKEKL